MMDTTDLPLFTQTQSALARRQDRATSHAGATWLRRSGRLARQQRAVYRALCERPGATAREIALVLGLTDVNIPARRLPTLEERGFVKRGPKRTCQVTGMIVGTWYPVGHDRGTLPAHRPAGSRPERREPGPITVTTPEDRRKLLEDLAAKGDAVAKRLLESRKPDKEGAIQ